MADRMGFAPASPAELQGWTGPDAGPPAPAVTSDPTRDRPGALSPGAASDLAGRLLGPAGAAATWTLTGPNTAVAVVEGRRLLVVDETDPYGYFTSLGLYQLVGCQVCRDLAEFDGQLSVPPAATAAPAPARPTGRRPGRAVARALPGSPQSPPQLVPRTECG
jgi:hypothetical protein